jgi:RNA polymerase sigma factor (sigma-70 family)
MTTPLGKELVTERQTAYLELLVLRCQRGRLEALEELVRMWEKRLFYYIRRLVDDEHAAWQVLQETWVKVLQGIGKLRTPECLPSWLYRIARNTALSHLRSKYRDELARSEDAVRSDADAGHADLTVEDAEQVHYGLARLSLRHREVLTLFFLQDLSIPEIGDVLGASEGAVRSRLYHAKRALRSVLEETE